MKLNLQAILFCLIFKLSIVIDLVNGYLQLTKGISFPFASVLRILIILILLYMFFRQRMTKEKKYLMIVIGTFAVSISLWVINNVYTNIFVELEAFIRILYLFLLIVYMSDIYQTKSKQLNTLIINYGFSIAICIVFSFITGIGHNSYGENYGFGTKSFFTAGNDVSIALLYSSIVCCMQLFLHFSLFAMLKYSIMFIGCVFVGTRTGIIGTCLISFILLIYYIFYFKPNSKKGILIKKVSIISVVPVLVYLLINFFAYILPLFDQFVIDRFSMEAIFSVRDNFTVFSKKYISLLSGLSWFIGNGRYEYSKYIGRFTDIGEAEKIAEADFYDTIGSYGYFLGFLFLFPVIYMLFRSASFYFQKKSFQSWLTIISALLFVYISYNAGHCISNVMVAPIYAYLFAMAYHKGNTQID